MDRPWGKPREPYTREPVFAEPCVSRLQALAPPDACHCSQCRKWSGHVFASTDVPHAALTVSGAENVTWFRSSEKVRRGFCSTCGFSLFFDPVDQTKHAWIAVAMGALAAPTDTRLKIHIYVAEKDDYYDLVDGLPQNQH